jgi:alpha-glucuronidase
MDRGEDPAPVSSRNAPQPSPRYESIGTTPDDLLLFFHHVPYARAPTARRSFSTSTTSTTRGEDAASFVTRWRALDGKIDRERYAAVLAKLEYQAGHAIVWRDAVTNWFHWISGIDDAKGRVGRYPNRVEAESLRLDRFVVEAVTPWETASAGQAIRCPARAGPEPGRRATCAATLRAPACA